jgi:2-hydroxychromene-2-carboxylate isomerase
MTSHLEDATDDAHDPHSKTFDFAELYRGALVTIADGRAAEYVTAVFAAIWGKPEDLSQRSVLIDVLNTAGFDAQRLLERASENAIIAQLDSETKAAAMGVRGRKRCVTNRQIRFALPRESLANFLHGLQRQAKAGVEAA